MLQKSQNLQNIAKFQKFQLNNLVDLEECCKPRIYLQKSVPIQPKTSNILPKFCQKLATTLRVEHGEGVAVLRRQEQRRASLPRRLLQFGRGFSELDENLGNL